jgi:ferredoxin
MEMVGDKAVIDQDSCLGCGRCEEACDYDAINITIDDDSRVHQLIKKLESVVDVTPQQS